MQRFPYYKQLDSMDCGPSCLRMIAKYYGKTFTLQYLRSKSHISREGVSMMGISDAAEGIHFRTKGYRISWEQLREEVPFPCIVHWNQSHFVVVYNIIKKRPIKFSLFGKESRNEETILIADPAISLISYSKEEFLKCWLSTKKDGEREGTVLLLEPTPDFYLQEDESKGKMKFFYLLGYLRPYKKFILQLGFGIVTGSIISMIFPFLTKSIVDYGIGNSDLAFIAMVLFAQLMLTFGQATNSIIRSWIMLHITSRVSISLISDFLIKLMKLPMPFFDTKMVGDLMQRIDDHNRIQSFLTHSLIDIIFAVFIMVIYIFIMASYHLGILGIFFLGSTFYVGYVLLFMKKRRELDYKRFQQSAASQSNIVQLISGMHEIKLNACETQKRWEWERIQARLYKVGIKGLVLNQNLQIGGTLISYTKDIFITFLSAKAVINGDMTLGMMMAVQYIIGQLNAPIQQFIVFAQAAQDAKISLERLGEIHDKKNEESEDNNLTENIPLNKTIEIRNLTFQYEGPHSPIVLNNINLKIPSNKVTAIVGASGSGKTTLIKLLLGFYQLNNGEICLDNINIDKYSPSQWRQKCGVVMQEGFIFSDSISNNIGITDTIINTKKLDRAVSIANIKEFINALPLGYETKIGNEGYGLSTGQKQRILIARAVYKNPDYLFFDEATNALDANNERVIMDNLDKFFKGRTVVVIAHRLNTVKKANQIVVLDKGKIVELGNHQDLISRKGVYYNLVKDQLELGN